MYVCMYVSLSRLERIWKNLSRYSDKAEKIDSSWIIDLISGLIQTLRTIHGLVLTRRSAANWRQQLFAQR